MWNGKYQMEIGGINDLRPALVYPDFFQDCLTPRTVTVTAGIIADFNVPAVTAAAGMADTSHAVKRADGTVRSIRSQMHINSGRLDGFMAHECLDGEQVHTVPIQMGAESMAEGMAGKPAPQPSLSSWA